MGGRSSKPRRVRAFIGACFGVSLVVASLLALPASAAKQDTVTINLEMTTQQLPQYEVMKANFERVYPEIKVNLIAQPASTYAALLPTQLQGGNGPDLFITIPGTGGGVPTLPNGRAGNLADVSKLPFAKRIPKYIRPLVSDGGPVWAWPMDVYPSAIGYNADLFAKYGVKPAATFAQLLDVCQKIAGQGGVPIAISLLASNQASFLPMMLAGSDVYASQPGWNTRRKNDQVTFAGSAGWQKVFADIQKMISAKCFSPGATGVTFGSLVTQFASGQAAMTIGGTDSFSVVVAANPKLNLKYFPFPGDTAKTTRALWAAGALSINAKTTHLKEAQTFLTFVAREKQSTLYAKVAQTVAPFDWTRGILPPQITPLKPLIQGSKLVPFPNLSWNRSVYVTLAQTVSGFFTGQQTADQILQGLDRTWGT